MKLFCILHPHYKQVGAVTLLVLHTHNVLVYCLRSIVNWVKKQFGEKAGQFEDGNRSKGARRWQVKLLHICMVALK